MKSSSSAPNQNHGHQCSRRSTRTLSVATSLILLASCPSTVSASCHTDSNGYVQCDNGLSWASRCWIVVGAGVAFVALNILIVWLIRRHRIKAKQRLPAAANAVNYQPGEYWEQRREHLGDNYVPPVHLLSHGHNQPRRAYVPGEMTQSRNSFSSVRKGTSMPPKRYTSRTSTLPPAYEATVGAPPMARPPPVVASSLTTSREDTARADMV